MKRQTPRQITSHTILAFPDAIKLIREQQREIGVVLGGVSSLIAIRRYLRA